MPIKIASFNLENLFTRPTAMQISGATGQEAIDDHARGNAIICKTEYSADDKQELLELDRKYKFSARPPPADALVTLNKIRGQLFRRSDDGRVTVVADGVAAWTGWFELRRDDVTWEAVRNTGQVIAVVDPDILVCVEVENRPTLQRFNEQVLGALFQRRFEHVMVIDGNDRRGIDVGILSRYPIASVRSHVDDVADGERIFSRDCPEYAIELPGGRTLVVCPNHFKSKHGGNDHRAQDRRIVQGMRAAEILRKAAEASELTLLAGDLNDTPDSVAIEPLLQGGWADIQSHASYPKDRPGTFGTGLPRDKIDYIIMSPKLHETLVDVGIERGGTFHPKLWEPLDGVTKNTEASDHHCIWAKFEIQ